MPLFLLFLYTILLSFVVFQIDILFCLVFVVLHVFILYFVDIPIKKILRPLIKLIPFLLLIIVTSIFFTQGQEDWLDGLSIGMKAAAGFLVFVSVSGFYSLPKIENNLLALSKKYEFLTPLFLVQKYFSQEKGSGKNRKDKPAKKTSVWQKSFLQSKIQEQFETFSKTITETNQDMSSRMIVITTATAILFSTKIVRVLPGIPFASGQKLAIIIPVLFFVSRKAGFLSATVVALNVSLLSLFWRGFGQLGILDVVRTVALGFFVDLITVLLPLRGKALMVLLSLAGGVLGLGFGAFTGFLAYLFHVPGLIYLLLAPRIASNIFFGFLGGVVAFYIIDKSPKKR